jgi:hypothetical protein
VEDGGKDAGGEAKGSERRPKGGRKELAERRSAAGRIGRWGGEAEWAKEANGGVKERKDVGPGDMGGRVGGGRWGKENAVEEINGAVGGAGEAVPKGPPAAEGIREGSVIGMFAEEVAIVTASGAVGSRSRVSRAHG